MKQRALTLVTILVVELTQLAVIILLILGNYVGFSRWVFGTGVAVLTLILHATLALYTRSLSRHQDNQVPHVDRLDQWSVVKALENWTYRERLDLALDILRQATTFDRLHYLLTHEIRQYVRLGKFMFEPSGHVHSVESSTDDAVVDAYLNTNNQKVANRAFAALDSLAITVGYEDLVEIELRRGSFFRKVKAKLQEGLSLPEVQERLVKIERAIELSYIDSKQADVDTKEAKAVADLLTALQDIPEGCMRVGSLLLVKYQSSSGSVVLARNLSQLELRALGQFPAIQNTPSQTLELLAMAVDQLKASDEGTGDEDVSL